MSQEQLEPGRFPYHLPTCMGEIKMAMEEGPELYYITALSKWEFVSVPYECYVAHKSCEILSPLVRSYGISYKEAPELLIFPIESQKDGHELVEYELCKYRVVNGLLKPGEPSALIFRREAANSCFT